MKEIFSKLRFTEIFCLYVFTLCMILFTYIIYSSFHLRVELSTEVNQIMIALIGTLGAVVGYVVGSSKSSADKDKMIDKAMDNKTNSTN